MAVYLYLSMMGSINEIQIYYIHVVTIMLLISCIASLPFTNPLPWPYGIIKCLIECTPMFFEYCYELLFVDLLFFCILYSWEVFLFWDATNRPRLFKTTTKP